MSSRDKSDLAPLANDPAGAGVFQVTLLQVTDLQRDSTGAVLGLMASNSGLSLNSFQPPRVWGAHY